MTDDNAAPQVSVLALDFDGVMCDSIHECLRLSYAVFRGVEHGDEGDPARILTDNPPERPAALFLERRGIVRPAAHFYLLWKWIVDFPERDMAPAAFEAMAREYPQQIDAFGRLFVQWRTELRERFPAEWVRSNPIYPEVRAAWGRLRRVPVSRLILTDHRDVNLFNVDEVPKSHPTSWYNSTLLRQSLSGVS